MAASAETPADDIDGLLARYLGLLDEYTKLRSSLTALQINVYQGIARANFSAERGIRYGQELYDERMQASRTLTIAPREDGTLKFDVVRHGDGLGDFEGNEKHEANAAEDEDEDDKQQADDENDKVQTPSDPLKWFGILTPISLRLAQGKAVQAVEQVIPQLLTVDAEMADVELRVRRARKKRSKAEAAAARQQQASDSRTPVADKETAVASDGDTGVTGGKHGVPDIDKETRGEEDDDALASRLEATSIS